MDYIVHGVSKSWTRLSNFYFHFTTQFTEYILNFSANPLFPLKQREETLCSSWLGFLLMQGGIVGKSQGSPSAVVNGSFWYDLYANKHKPEFREHGWKQENILINIQSHTLPCSWLNCCYSPNVFTRTDEKYQFFYLTLLVWLLGDVDVNVLFPDYLIGKSVSQRTSSRDSSRDSPGVPMAKTPHPQCWGPGFEPWSGN